ncbi:MAG: alpha/beta hydrolase [Planctomycetota bacterium]
MAAAAKSPQIPHSPAGPICVSFLLALLGLTVVDPSTPTQSTPADAKHADVMVKKLWPEGEVPAWNEPTESERDTTDANGRKVAGKPVMRLKYVRSPEMHVYHPVAGPSKTVVLICPGGGFHILAWDLEGTEIAAWFASRGLSAAVLKYRCPTAAEPVRYQAPVQDCRRAIALLKQGDDRQPAFESVGLMGFSAGGHTVAQCVLNPSDSLQAGASPKVAFAVLVYPAYLSSPGGQLADGLVVNSDAPPMFFAHAADDRIPSKSSADLHHALLDAKVPSELHVFSSGGHGFGGRNAGQSTDHWLDLCWTWMQQGGWVSGQTKASKDSTDAE